MHALMKKRIIAACVITAVFAAGFGGGWRFGEKLFGSGPAGSAGSYQIRESGYHFISPLLECEMGPSTVGQHSLQAIGAVVERLVHGQINGTTVKHVSVYFRDLNNGPWFGVHEDEEYSPASLLKVVIMIACLKQAEKTPRFLDERVLYPAGAEDENRHESIRSSAQLVPGRTYTVDELITMMIGHSDNNAMQLLQRKLDQRTLGRTYSDLGLPIPETTGKLEDFMSVRSYASTFRVLFNASYLSRDMSERALGYLSRSEFQQGLVAGVPPGTVVAHKFGERSLGKSKEIKQLHDCGIVYHPAHPYLLCVMSRGDSFERLDDVIREVSRTVYTEVAARMGGQ
jgi:beta-lactamase class A